MRKSNDFNTKPFDVRTLGYSLELRQSAQQPAALFREAALGRIIEPMLLDDVGRRYADNLFTHSLENITKDQNRETAEIRADFARRNMLGSGGYIAALGRAALKQMSLLAQAKADSLVKAYEKSGLPFDDSALQEVTVEVAQLCKSQQDNVILNLSQTMRQIFGQQPSPSGMAQAVSAEIQQGATSIISRITRELRIRRDEVILDERRVRKAYAAGLGKEWDAFICHASEDKEDFVRSLANALQASGLKVWYDEFTLKVGDSLRTAIDEGLARSRFGIVVLSNSFFAKQWPRRELDGLVSKEIAGVKVILPVWHKISLDDVRRNSPMLAGVVAAKSSDGLDTVVRQLRDAMGL